MAAEKALGIIVRTHDWSETSRIATIWTREFGKVRVLAKGGRRIKSSSFEVALDLLTVCSIVLLRKSSGGLELLTEARVEERFAGLKTNLRALYAGYYIAELLGDGTQEYDPHPALFDYSLQTLRRLSTDDVNGLVSAYELRWLDELGLRPVLDQCVSCAAIVDEEARLTFSALGGGMICVNCAEVQRDRRIISRATLDGLRELAAGKMPKVSAEIRQILGHTVSTVLGRRPRLLGYLS